MRDQDFPGGQWLRLHTSAAGGAGSIPGQRTKMPRATQPKKNNFIFIFFLRKSQNKLFLKNKMQHHTWHVCNPWLSSLYAPSVCAAGPGFCPESVIPSQGRVWLSPNQPTGPGAQTSSGEQL